MADSRKDNSGKQEARKDGRIVHFTDLNMFGKAVFVGGIFTRAATKFVDSTIQATVDIVTEAEKAFKQGLDPNIEEAKIIEELDDKTSSKHK